MKISLNQVAKRFIRHRIFQDVSLSFEAPGRYALLGANGSGKSTLMRIIGGIQSPSKGTVTFSSGEQVLPQDQWFRQIAYCAPGMDLVEELSLRDFLDFHFSFKPLLPGLSISELIRLTGLQAVSTRPLSDFSSGMKQRVKLIQAFGADTPALLLDEPCTNLDEQGVAQYLEWIDRFAKGRLLIVASNDIREYACCATQIRVSDFQPA